jgi:hypothetical protein
VDRDGVALAEVVGGREVGVEPGGHEVRRAVRVEVEQLGGVVGDREALLLGPGRHLAAAAPHDGHVEGVDLDVLEDLDRLLGRRGVVTAVPIG